MVKTFEQYHQTNEGVKSSLAGMAIFLTLFFNNIGGDVARRYDAKFFNNYVKTLNIANTDQLVQKVIKDFKYKISTDSKILNKHEVYDKIDSTFIVFRRNDEINYTLYRQSKIKHTDSTPSSWCTTIKPKDGKAMSVIFLARDASYNEIFHELSHAIESIVKIDPRIIDMFNFNYNKDQQNLMYNLITKGKYSMTKAVSSSNIEYLKEPGEIYSRLNNLKNFLYKKGFLSTPSQDISEELMTKLLTGLVYVELDEKGKEEFINSDFIQILIFFNIKKINTINQFVTNLIKTSNVNFS